MIPDRIELRFRDDSGASHALALDRGQTRAEHDGIVISARNQTIESGNVARVAISNRGGRVFHLDSVRYDLSTGFSAGASARFFKHGYQSWSASYPVPVGTVSHPPDDARVIVRRTHQSEAARPPEAPEAATSELLTIVESGSSAERFLAGFIGSASQLTTITVKSPDRVSARSLLDGATLGPGQTREIEPIASWRSSQSASRMAARWAAMLGEAMLARVSAPYQRGWCSWYHYFHAITEDALISNLRALKEMRSQFPLEVVQLDDGYQAALGDWDRTNARFPSGLKSIADAIGSAGFSAGLWTAPFLAARDSRIMRENPDWFIRDRDGAPLRAAYNPKWTPLEDKFAYALDPSNPGFAAHLERLLKILVDEFGYDYLKLDFLFAAAAEGLRHDSALTRAETLRRGLEAIRRGAGEKTFILGCGCPMGPAVGIVDGMRIGPDVAPYWGAGSADPGTAPAIDAIVTRSFMHRRLWLNDPDCVMLRAEETRLSSDEREALAWTIAASGGMLLVSDDMGLLSQESAGLFRAVAAIGAEVDGACLDEPPDAANLMDGGGLKILSTRMRDGKLHLVLNMSDQARDVCLAEVLPAYASASLIALEGEPDAGERLGLAPHSARIVRTR
jgi:alpha-galactosidase